MTSTQHDGLIRTGGGWLAVSYPAVSAVLGAPELEVPEAPPVTEVGSVAWLRASVSRFVNGPVHERRRAHVIALLEGTDPGALREDAYRRACADDRPIVEIGRRVPVATLAAALGAHDPDAVADAVPDCAAGYFPTSDVAVVSRADRATARLVELLRDPDLEITVARIAALVQGCDATAGLITAALNRLPSTLTSDDLVHHAALQTPPLRVMRRVATAEVTVAGQPIAPGDVVVCDIEQAGKSASEILTFGLGPRSCPGVAQALALAAGVIDAAPNRGG